MEKSDKKDLYKTGLKRQDAYITFLAACEIDMALLPEPITQTEKRLYELCKEKAEALTPSMPNGDSIIDLAIKKEEAPAEEVKPVKRTAKRTTKK